MPSAISHQPLHDPALRPHQDLRRPRPLRPRHVADHGSRARRPVRAERRRQDHAPQDDGRARRARRGRHPQAVRADRRLPAAGRPQPRRPHGVRRSVERLRRAAGDEGRDARARGPARRRVDSGGRARRDAAPLQRSAGSLPPARRLQHRAEDGDRAAGPRLQDQRLRAADRDVLRRLADAHRAGQAAARRAQPAAARRADQPPRSRGAQLARGVPERLPVRGHPGLARPLLPRRRRHAHRRPHAADAHRLPHQLQRLPRRAPRADRGDAEGQARAGRGGRARQDVHRPLPLPGDQGVAGAEPDQDAREGGADRGAARAQEDPLQLSGLRQERPDGARAEARRARRTASSRSSTTSTCTSSAAIASRSSAPTASASRR